MGNQGTIEQFEDLRIFQEARTLTQEIYALTRSKNIKHDYGLVDQLRRASVSIMSNIAEGFERGGNKEFSQFLWIAKGSCGEIMAQLYVCLDQAYISSDQFETLYKQTSAIAKMIGKLIQHLKQSEYKGAKHKS